MKYFSIGALALTLFIGSAQAGNVSIDDSTEGGIGVAGTFANFNAIDNEHISFNWLVTLPVANGQQGNFYTAMTSDGALSDLVLFNLGAGNNFVSVDFYSDGGQTDINALFASIVGTYTATPVGSIVEDGTFQVVANYLDVTPGNGFPVLDTLYVKSDVGDVDTPEPTSGLLLSGSLIIVGMYFRRRHRA